MIRLVRRAATCAGLAAFGWFTHLQAQSTTVVVPNKTEYRRALPLPTTAAPVIQQSPNGLYQLSITDTGIELRGPKGTVTINDTGIQIGGPGTILVNVEAREMALKVDQDTRLRSGRNMTLEAGANLQMKGTVATDIWGNARASLTGSQVLLACDSNGRPVARLGDHIAAGNPGAVVEGSPRVLAC